MSQDKPSGKSNGEAPVRFEAPQVVVTPSGVQGLPGAANATLVLGAGLIGVSLWQGTLAPLLDSAWNGKPLKITVPPGAVLGETLFVGALVFISTLSADFAQVAFWLILALWVLWLVRNPTTLTTALGWLTQSPTPAPAEQVPPSALPKRGGATSQQTQQS